MMSRLVQSRPVQGALVALMLGLAVSLVWWRGPDWNLVYHAFDFVNWVWIIFALALNLASVVTRALAWQLTIVQALDPPDPPFNRTFSAFAVGLLGNAALPGRIGELARVAVLRRRLPEHGSGTSAALVGTVFAHRLFDLVPALALVGYVLATAKIPHWAVTSLVIVSVVGIVLFLGAILVARRRDRPPLDSAKRLRHLLAMARQGLSVMKAPAPAAGAILLQSLGWFLQLIAVYVAMRAFDIHAPLPAAGLVLLLMNVATIFPLWPGNIGLLQAAVALPLVQYGVPYSTGFAFGIVLQVIEMSVGVGVGLIFLAREGLSFATLRDMPEVVEVGEEEDELLEELEDEPLHARAGVPG
jgi:glycosyltransferase 2 family protein